MTSASAASGAARVKTETRSALGEVTAAICKEQLLYEIHAPRRYYQPDVVADFSEGEQLRQMAHSRTGDRPESDFANAFL
jgi:hypothetical protein